MRAEDNIYFLTDVTWQESLFTLVQKQIVLVWSWGGKVQRVQQHAEIQMKMRKEKGKTRCNDKVRTTKCCNTTPSMHEWLTDTHTGVERRGGGKEKQKHAPFCIPRPFGEASVTNAARVPVLHVLHPELWPLTSDLWGSLAAAATCVMSLTVH